MFKLFNKKKDIAPIEISLDTRVRALKISLYYLKEKQIRLSGY